MNIFLTGAFIGLFGIRSLRWLALAQQKEYRADRLWLYVQSHEGMSDLLRVIPRHQDLSRSGLKRPRITPRIAVVTLTYGFLTFGCVLASVWLLKPVLDPARWWLFEMAGLALLVCAVPALVALSIMPSTLVSWWSTRRMLQRAQQKLAVHHPLVIGITGSYGKSSTKHLLAHVLRERYSVFATPKSFNTRYSVALSIVQGYTDQSVAILEYGAYGPGEIATLARWFVPKLALITGLTRQHLGLFKSLEGIVQAKSELVQSLPGGGIIFYNSDDAQVERIVKRGLERSASSELLQVIPSGTSDPAAQWTKPKLNELGQLEFTWGGTRVSTKLVGVHYFSLLKLVAVVARKLAVPDEAIVRAFETFVPTAGFISAYETNSGAIIIDDGGTSNPQGFSAAIELVKSLKPKQAVLITPGIIDLGPDEAEVHDQLAEQATTVFQDVWYLGVSGKSSFAKQYADALLDDRELISDALLRLDRDTMVLVEGRMPAWLTWHLEQLKK